MTRSRDVRRPSDSAAVAAVIRRAGDSLTAKESPVVSFYTKFFTDASTFCYEALSPSKSTLTRESLMVMFER